MNGIFVGNLARRVLASAVCLLLLAVASPALADAVIVPYTGVFDEASVPGPQGGLPPGDYDTIGGPADVGQFNLVDGSNVFHGSARTPNDSSDVFLIGIGSLQTLTGAQIVFGTNLGDFTPMFAAPAPHWSLEEFDATPTIFNLQVGSNGLDHPQLYLAPAFSRGEGIYSVFIGNGTFARNDNAPISYTMTFSIETAAVPEPSTIALALSFVVVCLASGLVRRYRRRLAA